MTTKRWNQLAALIFIAATCGYIAIAWLVSHDTYRYAFDSIHGYRVFDIDDFYRRYLAANPFSLLGQWVWNFYLPFNFIVDGIASRLSNHNEFVMRLPHILANLSGIALIYRTGRYLSIHAGWLLLSCTSLLLMPLFMLGSMSFYGESLLMPIIAVVIYATLTNKQHLANIASVMPFIRPEGIFYLGFYSFHSLLQKRYKQVVILTIPALIYFIVILVVFDFSISSYWQDRSAYGAMYAHLAHLTTSLKQLWLPFITINPLWWLLGFAGYFMPQLKPLRPLFAGAVVLVLYWAQQTYNGNANGEARYYLSLMPLFALSQAALLNNIVIKVKQHKRISIIAATLVMLFITGDNLLQIDPIRKALTNSHRLPFILDSTDRSEFLVLDKNYTTAVKQIYAFACAYSEYNKHVKKIIINAPQWFSQSNICHISDDIKIELSFIHPSTVNDDLDGYFYTMYPELPHYSFYQLTQRYTTTPSDKALYITFAANNINDMSSLFSNEIFSAYLVSYKMELTTPFYSSQYRVE